MALASGHLAQLLAPGGFRLCASNYSDWQWQIFMRQDTSGHAG